MAVEAADALLCQLKSRRHYELTYWFFARTRSCSRVDLGETTPCSRRYSLNWLSDHLLISGCTTSHTSDLRVDQGVAKGLKVSLSGTSGTSTPLSRQRFVFLSLTVTYSSGSIGISQDLLPDLF